MELKKLYENLIVTTRGLIKDNKNLKEELQKLNKIYTNLEENNRILTLFNISMTENIKILTQDNENLKKINQKLNDDSLRLTQIKKFQDLKHLSTEECSKFDTFLSVSKKLDYLRKLINWQPIHDGKYLNLLDIFSYKNCEYFIGYRNSSVIKFSLYKDYSKSIEFTNIDKIVFSSNNEYIAISDNFFKFYQIDLNNFDYYSIHYSIFKYNALIAFSPDSSFVFFTKKGFEKILVYSTSDKELVRTFDLQGKKPIQIILSKNLYHLIVKDEDFQIKVFSIKN